LTQRKGAYAKDFNFLNGNTLSLNLKKKQRKVAAGLLGLAAKQQGKQSRNYITAPVAKSFKGLSSRAKVTTMSSGVTRVKHSEYIKDIGGSMDFTVDANPINPGEPNLFPWLSSIAARFESYQFRNLNFRYETTSPTSTAGSVIITVDYNPQASPPDSKVQALAMESSVRTAPWGSVNHRSLPHNLTKRKSYYINNGDPSIFDPDLFDTGVMMVMTEGIPSESGSVGEMYVDYEVDLITPTLTDFAADGYSGQITATSLVTPANLRFLFEAGVDVTPSDAPFTAGPGYSVNAGTLGGVQFQEPGTYLVSMMFTSSSITLPEDNWSLGSSSDLTVTQVIPIAPGTVVLDTTTNTATATFVVTQQKEAAPFSGILGFGNTSTIGIQTGVVDSVVMIAPFAVDARRRPRRRAIAAARHIGSRRPHIKTVQVYKPPTPKESIKPRSALTSTGLHPQSAVRESREAVGQNRRPASAAVPIPRRASESRPSNFRILHGFEVDEEGYDE